MPPAARARQLNSGRYASFSPEERELLTNASQRPLAEAVN
jgi:DNA-directed RNA polymerase subunit K/omega